MTSVMGALSQTYTGVKEAVMGAPEDEPQTTAGVKTRRVEQENTETNEASGAEPKQSKKQKKPKQPAGHEPSSDQSTAAFGPEPNPALKPESAPESGPEEPEQIFRLTDEEFARLSQAQRIAGSWADVLGAPIDTMRQASAALSNLDRTATAAQIQEWRRAESATSKAFKELKQGVNHNLTILAPHAVQANARAAELLEQNEQLEAQRRTASEAAQEAASKLQQTQVALHQSAAGHSNIASTFPLSTEIADKVATFGADGFAELVLDHALAAAPNLLAATDDLRVLLQYASDTVLGVKERVEQGVFGASPRAPCPARSLSSTLATSRLLQAAHACSKPRRLTDGPARSRHSGARQCATLEADRRLLPPDLAGAAPPSDEHRRHQPTARGARQARAETRQLAHERGRRRAAPVPGEDDAHAAAALRLHHGVRPSAQTRRELGRQAEQVQPCAPQRDGREHQARRALHYRLPAPDFGVRRADPFEEDR